MCVCVCVSKRFLYIRPTVNIYEDLPNSEHCSRPYNTHNLNNSVDMVFMSEKVVKLVT